MSSTIRQLSSGLNPDSERTVRACPDIPAWTENLLFTPYDPVNDVGMWLHLGTVADKWEMWEDRVLIALPEDQGVLSMWAYHRTVAERQPAGANLEFQCEQPFQKWRITFDGYCLRSSYEQMRTGLLVDGPKSHVRMDLEVECATPVWDAATAGEGMAEQSWAREHYEQLTRVTGHVVVDGVAIDFNGVGWRDHSRGPRGADTLRDWGGHVITGAVLPGGRAFGMCRYWARDGHTTLEGAYVVEDGTLRHVDIVSAPPPATLARDGETFSFTLGGGRVIDGVIRSSMWITMADGLPYGVADPVRAYTVSWAEVQWAGETGYSYIERSAMTPSSAR
ncbi:DUF7065 domain-containing protein [Mycolicibacterium flavescens]|uniref:6-phosphofructokinase n=1 Tax=Mycolicibacterium flavescens TaxID=1776 RepID=A0A1E3RND4_MYCFV|nr:6-phosphofructokinase [Mycolicibacterium flavescens]ODQ91364.1 6-phosphofructokinase [Mycolicibacterium flavescens]